jgi:hypothetical protein
MPTNKRLMKLSWKLRDRISAKSGRTRASVVTAQRKCREGKDYPPAQAVASFPVRVKGMAPTGAYGWGPMQMLRAGSHPACQLKPEHVPFRTRSRQSSGYLMSVAGKQQNAFGNPKKWPRVEGSGVRFVSCLRSPIALLPPSIMPRATLSMRADIDRRLLRGSG